MALVYEYMSEGTLQEQIAGMPQAIAHMQAYKSSAFAQHTVILQIAKILVFHMVISEVLLLILVSCSIDSFSGNGRNGKRLTWRQRLRIALDSAQGNIKHT